jgi:hypothetical protein
MIKVWLSLFLFSIVVNGAEKKSGRIFADPPIEPLLKCIDYRLFFATLKVSILLVYFFVRFFLSFSFIVSFILF